MHVDGLKLRRVLGADYWSPPKRWGNGWVLRHKRGDGIVIATWAVNDGEPWIHASMSRKGRVPTYEDLKLLHAAAFPGWAYSVWAPPAEHVNQHNHVLHLFGPVDGQRRLPDFTMGMRSI